MDREKAYQSHLELKTRSLCVELDRLGYGSLCSRIIHAPLEGGFRSRAKFKIYTGPETGRVCGTDPSAGEVPVEDMLWILPGWARDVVRKLPAYLLSKYADLPVDGFEVKLAHGRQEFHLTLSVKRGKGGRSYEPLAAEILSRIPGVLGVAVPSRRESFGDEWIRHRIDGREFLAHYSAFFQSHPGLTLPLLQEVRNISRASKGRAIVDLYCGVGLFSLFLGSPDTPILGVDNHAQAVDSAKRNAERMGFQRAQYVCAEVESWIQMIDLQPRDLVLLDPPRSGCRAQIIRAIAAQNLRDVCLISCFPQTHFRDLEVWRSAGYSLSRMSALDMFPFTRFLETVSLLERLG
jgi:tRNA/tmRNA/rRNA uracil-C5-methylase (TrmA/RlmC/RlmD family)